MKASRNFIAQKGLSSIVGLVILGLGIIILLQLKTVLPTKVTTPQKSKLPQVEITTKKVNPVDLRKYIIAEAALLGVADNISLYFKDTKNNTEVSIDPSKSWIPASTIKAFVLLEAFRQKRLGLINFDQHIKISNANVVPTELETEEFPRLREGTDVTIRQLVEAMIIQSDNTAYNSLLDILDRRNINNSLKNAGITETIVGEKLNLDADQYQNDLVIAGRQPNTTTAKDLADYFSLLYNHKIPDAEEILDIFKRQKINNMIPAKLPDSTIVAHKTGDWAPIYHDGGIVYKPNDPFIFVVFTSSGDPAIVSKLAQVAYFQDPKYVGKNVAYIPQKKSLASIQKPVYYNDSVQSQVLGISIDDKFPSITAEDLGITAKDLTPDARQIDNVASAWILPGSPLFEIKKFFETQVFKKSSLNTAQDRLSQVKGLMAQGDIAQVNSTLSDAVDDIKNATDQAKKDPKLLLDIKKTNDLYYAVMEQKAASVPDDKKAEFVDAVYNFYEKSKKEVSPVLNASIIVSPTQQKPTIGVVEKITSDNISLKFEDGSTKQVSISDGTNVRSVNQESSEDLSNIKQGSKIAVLGPSGDNNSSIHAQFILNNIPQELTDQHKGIVTEINTAQKVVKLIDQKGQVNLVKIDDNTSVKSKDTNVTIDGIKAGSSVVIFGTSSNTIPSPSSSAILNSSPSISPSISPTPGTLNTPSPTTASKLVVTPNPTSNPQTKSTPVAPKPSTSTTTTTQVVPVPITQNKPVEIKATSITVVVNNSGKNEQKKPEAPAPAKSEPAKSESAKPEPANPATPTKSEPAKPAEPAKVESTKKEDKK